MYLLSLSFVIDLLDHSQNPLKKVNLLMKKRLKNEITGKMKKLNKTQFTRKQLYDLVWSKPLSHLAKDYNISDNGLRKICKKHNIPLPKMGHWQKIQYGKQVKVVLLPKVDNDKEVQISLDDREVEGKEEHILSKLARISKGIETEYPKFIEVTEQLVKPDILVREARKELRTKKASNWRNHKECIYTSTGILSISVEKQNVLRILG